MKSARFATFLGAPLVGGFALAATMALVWAAAAGAQTPGASSADEAYPTLDPPSGPAAGTNCLEAISIDGRVNTGDTVTYPGDFSVAPGASVVLDDSDLTQGTLIDGANAEISEIEGDSIEIVVTGDPLNVVGGDGVLSDDVCESIVATTGISGGAGDPAADPPGGDPSAEGPAVAVLPETGGPVVLLVVLGTLLAATGAGILLPRLRAGDRGSAR